MVNAILLVVKLVVLRNDVDLFLLISSSCI